MRQGPGASPRGWSAKATTSGATKTQTQHATKRLRVTYVKSAIGYHEKQKLTIEALIQGCPAGFTPQGANPLTLPTASGFVVSVVPEVV